MVFILLGSLGKLFKEQQVQSGMANATRQGAAKLLLWVLYYTSVTHTVRTDGIPAQGTSAEKNKIDQEKTLTIS